MSGLQKILKKKASQPKQQQEPSTDFSWIGEFNSQTSVENSMSQWPSTPELKKSISVPLCLALCPFEQSDLPELQQVNDLNTIRCVSCKAFVNRLCYVSSQNSYDCSLCGSSTVWEKPLDLSSPAFQNMSYEIQVGDAHRLKVNTPPTLALVIDISRKASTKGYLSHLSYSLKEYIKSLPNKGFFQILIITFDKYPHYYSLSGHLTQRIIIVDECPEREIELLEKVEDKILEILNSLEELSANNHIDSSEGLANALELAINITRVYSGRILLFSGIESVLPEARLKEPPTNEHLMENFKALDRRFLKNLKNVSMSVSIFIFNDLKTDLLTYYGICKYTNGSLHHYQRHQELKFYYDLNTLLYATNNYDVLVKVRCTPGIKLASVFGSYIATDVSDQINLSTCNSYRNYILEFNIEAKINSPYSVVQLAIIFTTAEGKRKFRIINYVVQTQEDPVKCLKSIDYSLVNYFYIKASSQSLDTNLEHKVLRTIVQDRFSSHMKFYREHTTHDIFNDDVTLYSRMAYCILRSHVLNPTSDVTSPFENQLAAYYRSLNLGCSYGEIALLVYPMPYGITEHGEEVIQLTVQNIRKYSIVVLDRFVELIVWFNLRADRLREIFGKKVDVKLVTEDTLKTLEGPEIRVLESVISTLRGNKSTGYQPVRFLSNIDGWMLFSVPGNYGYENFVNNIIK